MAGDGVTIERAGWSTTDPLDGEETGNQHLRAPGSPNQSVGIAVGRQGKSDKLKLGPREKRGRTRGPGRVGFAHPANGEGTWATCTRSLGEGSKTLEGRIARSGVRLRERLP